MRNINTLVQQHTGHPLVTMVLEQQPQTNSLRHDVNLRAQDIAKEAGHDVIPINQYLDQYDGQMFIVSRWDFHPNEIAHALFADMFYHHIVGKYGMNAYKR